MMRMKKISPHPMLENTAYTLPAPPNRAQSGFHGAARTACRRPLVRPGDLFPDPLEPLEQGLRRAEGLVGGAGAQARGGGALDVDVEAALLALHDVGASAAGGVVGELPVGERRDRLGAEVVGGAELFAAGAREFRGGHPRQPDVDGEGLLSWLGLSVLRRRSRRPVCPFYTPFARVRARATGTLSARG